MSTATESKQTDICVCRHSRATHFEEKNQACSLGNCLCEGFDKQDPLIAAAPTMLEALKCAKTVLYLLSEEVNALGLRANKVPEKVQAAICLAEGETL